jgi:hypothetical protein
MRIARLICSLLLAVGVPTIPVQSRAQVAVGISVRIGPPVLPVYAQPICPEPGFIWVPGYWAFGDDGYFWVPGTWVEPPEVGLLWTPGYWAFEDSLYVWSPGYWGPEVGFYGGINYGFGYTGVGFYGGYWRGRTYYYNREVTNVDVTVVHNTYNTTVVNNNTSVNRVSFNGRGGTTASPTSQEMAAARQHHVPLTSEQTQHEKSASSNRTLLASVNHGRPDIAATPRPGRFGGRAAATTGRPVTPNRFPENPSETNRPGNPPANSERVNPDRPPSLRSPSAVPVNPRLEQKHQQELDQLHQRQTQERQRVEQKHQQEQQKLQQHAADDRKQQDTQRKQQQQLQQLEQKHAQQQQKLQQKQQQERQRQQKPEKPPSPSKP